jgi:hypothetical protein
MKLRDHQHLRPSVFSHHTQFKEYSRSWGEQLFFIAGQDGFTCMMMIMIIKISKGRGKAIPLQAWTSPEGSRRLRLSDLRTIVT